jgi:hypothetical protein
MGPKSYSPQSRWHQISHGTIISNIRNIVKEFKLNITLNVYGNTTRSCKVKIRGDPKKSDHIAIAIYHGHYFLQEPTPFNDIDFGVKVRSDKGEPYKPLELTSVRLLMLLLELDLMRPITVREIPDDELLTDFVNLNYNNEYCIDREPLPPPRFELNMTQVINKPKKYAPRYDWIQFS